MKNKDAATLLNGIISCDSLTHQTFDMTKFSFALAKNYHKVIMEIKPFEDEKKKLMEEVDKIRKECADRDEKGEIIYNDKKEFTFNVEKFNKLIEEGKFQEKLDNLEDIEIKVELHKIGQESVPPNIEGPVII